MTDRIDRALASLTPLPAPSEPIALERMQRARMGSSIVWLAGGVVVAHLAGVGGLWAGPSVGGWHWFALTALVAVAMLVAGAAQLLLLVRAERQRVAAAATIAAVAALGVLTAPFAGLLLLMLGVFQLAAPIVAMGFGIALLAFDPSMRVGARRPWLGAVSGFVVVVLALAAGVVDTLLLMPLAMAPGLSLTEISAALVAAGEDGGQWLPLAWGTLWVIAAALLGLGTLRNRRSQRSTLGLLLGATTAALLALPIVQFPMGMSMGDTFVTQGAVSAAFPALIFSAALCAVAASALLIDSRRS